MTALCGAFCLLIVNCGNNPAGTPEKKTTTSPISAPMGAKGGSLSIDSMTISFGAGAFDRDTTLVLYSSADTPFGGNAVSGLYILKGLPTTFTGPITVRIKLSAPVSDSVSIASGEDVFATSTQSIVTSYHLFQATINNGTAICTLYANGAQSVLSKKTRLQNAEQAVQLALTGVDKYTPFTTPQKHFHISYPSSINKTLIVNLGAYLETAFDTITTGLKFSVAGRTLWPVDVTVRTMEEKDYGSYYSSVFGDNFAYMEFNGDKLSVDSEISVTAGHEFFHLVQLLYDTRNFYSKSKAKGPNLWIEEACAVWSEAFFSSKAAYVPSVCAGTEMEPFTGIIAGNAVDEAKHGYGLSALIKFLAMTYGREKIAIVFDNMKAGNHPIQSIISAMGEAPPKWWPKFFSSYVAGKVYKFATGNLIGNKAGLFAISGSADTLKEFSRSYPDLSAALYMVQLSYKGIDTLATLKITGSAATGHPDILLFSYSGGSISFISMGTDSIVSPNLGKLANASTHLLAVVVNSNCTPPSYTAQTPVTMVMRLTRKTSGGLPAIIALKPDIIHFNDTVTIIGSSLGQPQSDAFIQVGSYDTLRHWISWSDTQIVFIAPPKLISGSLWVYNGGKFASGSLRFSSIMDRPRLYEINPSSVLPEGIITLKGAHLRQAPYIEVNYPLITTDTMEKFYHIGDTTLLSVWNDSTISVKLPIYAKTGLFWVKNSGGTSNSVYVVVKHLSQNPVYAYFSLNIDMQDSATGWQSTQGHNDRVKFKQRNGDGTFLFELDTVYTSNATTRVARQIEFDFDPDSSLILNYYVLDQQEYDKDPEHTVTKFELTGTGARIPLVGAEHYNGAVDSVDYDFYKEGEGACAGMVSLVNYISTNVSGASKKTLDWRCQGVTVPRSRIEFNLRVAK